MGDPELAQSLGFPFNLPVEVLLRVFAQLSDDIDGFIVTLLHSRAHRRFLQVLAECHGRLDVNEAVLAAFGGLFKHPHNPWWRLPIHSPWFMPLALAFGGEGGLVLLDGSCLKRGPGLEKCLLTLSTVALVNVTTIAVDQLNMAYSDVDCVGREGRIEAASVALIMCLMLQQVTVSADSVGLITGPQMAPGLRIENCSQLKLHGPTSVPLPESLTALQLENGGEFINDELFKPLVNLEMLWVNARWWGNLELPPALVELNIEDVDFDNLFSRNNGGLEHSELLRALSFTRCAFSVFDNTLIGMPPNLEELRLNDCSGNFSQAGTVAKQCRILVDGEEWDRNQPQQPVDEPEDEGDRPLNEHIMEFMPSIDTSEFDRAA